jgi:hypothetical protein
VAGGNLGKDWPPCASRAAAIANRPPGAGHRHLQESRFRRRRHHSSRHAGAAALPCAAVGEAAIPCAGIAAGLAFPRRNRSRATVVAGRTARWRSAPATHRNRSRSQRRRHLDGHRLRAGQRAALSGAGQRNASRIQRQCNRPLCKQSGASEPHGFARRQPISGAVEGSTQHALCLRRRRAAGCDYGKEAGISARPLSGERSHAPNHQSCRGGWRGFQYPDTDAAPGGCPLTAGRSESSPHDKPDSPQPLRSASPFAPGTQRSSSSLRA